MVIEYVELRSPSPGIPYSLPDDDSKDAQLGFPEILNVRLSFSASYAEG
tara:strand:- start:735 stop:881 length:147 start_codon:yes stop_codon:yes gene_type:complete